MIGNFEAQNGESRILLTACQHKFETQSPAGCELPFAEPCVSDVPYLPFRSLELSDNRS